jgi:anti-sigma-K factor RskA
MDHEGTREQLELAAVEPGGLERLMAGDTATAQAVAAHLAGCPACSDELVRLQRAATIIRDAVREQPPADLKARTLAAIRTEGVRRPLVAVGAAPSLAAATVAIPDASARSAIPAPAKPAASRRWAPPTRWLGYATTIAAAVLLSVVTTTAVVNNRVDSEMAAQNAQMVALESVTAATMGVSGEPDAEHVDLRSVDNSATTGDLVYSPSTLELVVVAKGLTPPPAGQEYRCWVQVNGQRERIGKMFFSAHLAYWTGPVQELQGVSDGATFGVSLVDASGNSVDTAPVLLGQL